VTGPAARAWAVAALAPALAALAWAAPEQTWPPFLASRDGLAADVALLVERTWGDLTFSRTVKGRPARAPFDLYAALVDTPEVTAAAARFRELARHEVRWLGPDWYEADDGGGSRGEYRVLVNEPRRRVILSWGEHESLLIGTIRGSALTEMLFEPRGDRVDQQLTAHVRIEHRLAAAVTRALLLLFGGLADRRLREAFETASSVAEWAVARPEEFCAWLARAPALPERREAIAALVPGCR
jgi:hypothetical protein